MTRTLLIIGYVWPEPTSSAAGSRMLQLIRVFAEAGWPITFACAAADSPHRADLSPWSVTEVPIRLNCDSFNDFVEQVQPTVVLFDRFVTEEQFGWRVAQQCPDALRVIDTEDLHSLRQTRERLLKDARRLCTSPREAHCLPPVNADAQTLWQKMLEADITLREIAAIYRSDLSLMISDVEMQLLQQSFALPGDLLHWIPFMHEEAGTAAKSSPPFAQRQHFVSLGNFRHPPNRDSVLWLKHQLWPLIRARLPRAELLVYGAYPDKEIHELHQPKNGFHVHGRAESARTVMEQARVCLAPLRFGAGLKGKLLDAMVYGAPSVTTGIGAEAMHGDLPWGGVIADSAEAFADAAIALHEQEDLWQQAQQRGRDIAVFRFRFADHALALLNRIEALLTQLPQHRRSNLTGLLLQHHQHRSTEYMSRWIALKNDRNQGSPPGE